MKVPMCIGVGLLLGASSLSAAPSYQAEPCCQLCPAAADARAYQAPGLLGYGRLIDAQEGWLFSTAQDLRSDFGLDEPSYKQLKRLRNALKQNGVELMLVYQPSRGLLHGNKLKPTELAGFNQAQAQDSYRATLARIRSLNIWVPDLASLLQAKPNAADYFFKGDRHWTPQGAERTAQLVAQTARQIPGFSTLPQQAFQSRPSGLMARSGSLQKAAEQICGAGYARQFVQSYFTEPVTAGAPREQAEVALVGSNNSRSIFNFAGFLEQSLSTPVYQVPQAEAGDTNTLLQYLLSAQFQRHPPKLLIWELADGGMLGKRNAYRQLVPAVADGCSGQPTLLQSTTPLRAGSTQVLFNGANGVLPIRSSDYRIDLRLDNPGVQQLSATLTFMNGRQENLTFDRVQDPVGQGRFLLELREDADWDELTFLSLNVQPVGPVTGKGSLHSKLCKAKSDAPRAGLRSAQAGVQQ
jgi:alginate biosynthesis protein AlgX